MSTLAVLAACLTLDQSAVAALDVAMPLSVEYEYGGALYVQKDGCHGFTAPQTSGSKYDLELHIVLPVGAHVAGIYHTHPGEGDVRRFSGNDVLKQRALRVPSYIGVVSTREVFALDKSPVINQRTSVLNKMAVYGREVSR